MNRTTLSENNASSDYFCVKERNSSYVTEALAGVTTFATMAYILAVNPAILSEAGMPAAELIVVTAIAAAVFSVLMGLVANIPIAQAPGMGANALFAYTLVLSQVKVLYKPHYKIIKKQLIATLKLIKFTHHHNLHCR